jgi:hypothetical protein
MGKMLGYAVAAVVVVSIHWYILANAYVILRDGIIDEGIKPVSPTEEPATVASIDKTVPPELANAMFLVRPGISDFAGMPVSMFLSCFAHDPIPMNVDSVTDKGDELQEVIVKNANGSVELNFRLSGGGAVLESVQGPSATSQDWEEILAFARMICEGSVKS